MDYWPDPDPEDNEIISYYRGVIPGTQPDCEHCPLRGSRIVPPEGNPRAKLAIVGESPGYQEEQELRPFIGPSGKFLDRLLAQAGVNRSEVWITNAALCRPKTVTIDGKPRNPKWALTRGVARCRKRLFQELALVNPRSIIAFGGEALRSLNGAHSKMDRRGAVHEVDINQEPDDL